MQNITQSRQGVRPRSRRPLAPWSHTQVQTCREVQLVPRTKSMKEQLFRSESSALPWPASSSGQPALHNALSQVNRKAARHTPDQSAANKQHKPHSNWQAKTLHQIETSHLCNCSGNAASIDQLCLGETEDASAAAAQRPLKSNVAAHNPERQRSIHS